MSVVWIESCTRHFAYFWSWHPKSKYFGRISRPNLFVYITYTALCIKYTCALQASGKKKCSRICFVELKRPNALWMYNRLCKRLKLGPLVFFLIPTHTHACACCRFRSYDGQTNRIINSTRLLWTQICVRRAYEILFLLIINFFVSRITRFWCFMTWRDDATWTSRRTPTICDPRKTKHAGTRHRQQRLDLRFCGLRFRVERKPPGPSSSRDGYAVRYSYTPGRSSVFSSSHRRVFICECETASERHTTRVIIFLYLIIGSGGVYTRVHAKGG